MKISQFDRNFALKIKRMIKDKLFDVVNAINKLISSMLSIVEFGS